jgi:DNA-binding GntR family transcriptional regulator
MLQSGIAIQHSSMNQATLPGSFTLDRSRSAAVQIYERLRELIVTLALAPGAALSRTEVAEYFKVSPMPVREAFARLASEGLIEIFPQYMTRVKGIDLDAARQAHVLRLALELEVVHILAQQPNPELEKQLSKAIAKQRTCFEIGDFDGFIAYDREFHRMMFEAAQLMDNWHLVRNASGNVDRLRRLHVPMAGKAERVLDEHGLVAAAIGQGNAAIAQQHIRKHLSGTLSELNSLRDRYPDYMLPITELPPRLQAGKA